jgi:hypothetical protein
LNTSRETLVTEIDRLMEEAEGHRAEIERLRGALVNVAKIGLRGPCSHLYEEGGLMCLHCGKVRTDGDPAT